MADATLKNFIRDALAAGESRDRIAAALSDAGWEKDQIEGGLAEFADIDFSVPVPKPARYGGAREAFLYIVFFSLLGMVATQIGRLGFALTDSLLTDPLYQNAYRNGARGLRWSVASLVVGYPIFFFLGARLGAARRKNPERRSSRIRAWLTYITLIFAALTLIGDLVVVVFNFLGGELGARFLIKAAIVGVISGAILWNFSRDAERSAKGMDMPGRALAIATTFVAIVLVAWAFLRVDNPYAARARGLDAQRLNDVSAIARQVDCYRSYAGALPESLAVMEEFLDARAESEPVAAGCAVKTPSDPVTDRVYTYVRGEGDAFNLCAHFDRGWPEGDEDEAPYYGSRYYGANRERRAFVRPEGSGEHCFELKAVDFVERDPDE